jgi:hypothetical protein
LFAFLTLWPWRWRRYFPPIRRSWRHNKENSTLHIVTAVKTSNPTSRGLLRLQEATNGTSQ